MPIQVMWQVAKSEGYSDSPMWTDKPTAEALIKQGVQPRKTFEHAGNTIAAFDPTEVRKATSDERKQALDGLMDDVIGTMRDMVNGRTRALTGNEAKLAIRIGAKPIRRLGSGAFEFRVADLNRAAQNLTPSEQSMVSLQKWYEDGR